MAADRKKIFKMILVCAGLVLVPQILCSQNIIFDKVQPPEGESFKHITGITQDLNGFIWLATKNGLYRYDGNQFIQYKNDEFKTNTIASNELESICVDSTGSIWIGMNNAGLDRFNPFTENFTHFRISSDHISALLTDHTGTIWIGTSDGLDKYDIHTNKFTHFKNISGDSTSLSFNAVNALYEDKQNNLWIGTGSVYLSGDQGGLNRMNKIKGTFTRFMHDPQNSYSITNNKVRAIYEDSQGAFWIGTAGDGLQTLNRETGKFTHYPYDPKNPEKLSRPPLNKTFYKTDFITFIKENATGNIWIGTSESGINLYNPKTKKITHYESGPDEPGSFSSRTTWWAFSSREGIIWISDIFGGLFKINPDRIEIPFENLSSETYCFFETSSREMWIGTKHGLIVKGKAETSQYLTGDIKSEITKLQSINTIKQDAKDNIWIGGTNGLLRINQNNKDFFYYKNKPENKNSLSSNNIFSLLTDKNGNIWIGTSNGLNYLNSNKNTINRFYIDSSSSTDNQLGINSIFNLFRDKNNKIWVGGYFNGLHRFDPGSRIFKEYIKDIVVFDIYEDRDNRLWVASNNGLYQYDPENDKFLNYKQINSFKNIPVVKSIIEDDQDNLWLGTSLGLIRLYPDRLKLNMFGKNFGIHFEKNFTEQCYKTRNGILYFGNVTGYYSFDPEKLPQKFTSPKIIISGFRISDQLVTGSKNISYRGMSSSDESIQLNYNQNIFSFDFASIDYSHSYNSQLEYKLENYDINWRKAGSDQRAYYFNVPAGNYIFKIKASNGYGLWSEKQLNLIINSPWWKTWWAYISYIVFGFGILYSIRRIELSRRQENENKRLLEAENKRKTEELEEARQLQLSMLPKELPHLPHLDIAVYMQTATEVGGDYYDFHVSIDGTLTVVIGDATGHGMKAGTMVTTAKSLFRSYGSNPDILFSFQEFSRCIREMNFGRLSMCLSMLKISDHTLHISSAAMPPAYVYRSKTKEVEEYQFEAMPLGAMNKFPYQVKETKLNTGDTILLMSDGLPELENNNSEMFGYTRIKDGFEKIAEKSPDDIISYLKDEGAAWADNGDPGDDVTFVVIKVK